MDGPVDVRETAKKSDARGAKESPFTNTLPKASPPRDIQGEHISRMLDPAVLGGLKIDIIAQLGRGMLTIDELARLGSGEVVRLDTPLNGVIDLTLNGALVARGEIVAIDDQFGVRVTEILVRAQ
ncbi:MAG: fliN [Novosphingobium sp.]|nr:fliN [Novosphingobium sp.]